MRIDPDTGVVEVPELGGSLAPTITRDEWLASAMARGGAFGVQNEPSCSYAARAFTSDGNAWTLSVRFHGQTLKLVELMVLDAEFGTSWEDWSRAKEQARQQVHDRWLTRTLAHRRTFSWGRVASVFDERAAYSSILVHYA